MFPYKIGVLDFDSCYNNQAFYKDMEYERIDFSYLSGINGYCSPEALNVMKKRLWEKDRLFIHFIGSGNYHYMTYLFLQRIRQPFSLVLFDHHTDILPPLCPELLSCGGWVKRVLDENKYIKEVLILGARQDLIEAIEPKYVKRVTAYSEETIERDSDWMALAADSVHYPCYCSVDKDVFRESEACTDWDNGSMAGIDFRRVCEKIGSHHSLLGMDVCGETAKPIMHSRNRRDIERNNQMNKMILNFILEQEETFHYANFVKGVS